MATVLTTEVFVNTEKLSNKEWLEKRRFGIGGSDIAAICGLSKWRRPIHVYLEKLGEKPDEELGEAAEWGTRLEPLIAEKFAQCHPGWAITEKKVIYNHPVHKWALGNLDRMIVCPSRGRGILEIKTASEYLKKDWDDGQIPDYYFVQLQWYMFVTGLEWGYFGTLIGGNKYREYEVFRDDELIDQLQRLAEDFWESHVKKKQSPPIDGTDASTKLLSRLYPSSNGLTIELTEVELIRSYIELKQQGKEQAEQVTELENKIKSLLGNCEIGVCGDYLIKWGNRIRNGVDNKRLKQDYPHIFNECIKQTSYRHFSVQCGKD